MHHNQISAFAAMDVPSHGNVIIKAPFTLNGWTYATDGRFAIRVPGHMDGFTRFDPNADEKAKAFTTAIESFFEPFARDRDTKPLLMAMAGLVAEPVIAREMHRDSDIDFENPAISSELCEAWVIRMTPTLVNSRKYDARRLLFIRQHFGDAHFIVETGSDERPMLRFVFGGETIGSESGQGILMGMNHSVGDGLLHWNGARYFNGW